MINIIKVRGEKRINIIKIYITGITNAHAYSSHPGFQMNKWRLDRKDKRGLYFSKKRAERISRNSKTIHIVLETLQFSKL
jgi:hypothetical protein